MVIISYTGLYLYLVGELNAKIHSQVSKILNIDEEEVVFTSYDSFVFYKGHEQTSINLLIKVEMDEKLKVHQKELADYLLKTSKDYSLHAFVYFNYFKDEDYDENISYSEEEIYTGNIFKDFGFKDDEDDEPNSFDDLTKK